VTPSHYRSAAGERAVMAAYDRAIEHWPVPCEGRMVPTRAGDTFVLCFGEPDAPPLVLLHGAATNSAMWAGDAAAYAPHFRVYAVDLPGEAGKSTPVRPPWQGPEFAGWLGDAFDGLGLDSARIAGISQGGWVALKLATAAPERVDRLVLISPAGVIADRPSFVLRALLYQRLGDWGARQIARMVFAPRPAPAEVAAGVAFMARHFRARVGILSRFTDDELRRVAMPALLVGGEGDALRDERAIARRLSELLPRLQTVLVPDAGHALPSVDQALPFLTTADAG
jgi:pimeloyl-ACP methyl ester carboxylesterase